MAADNNQSAGDGSAIWLVGRTQGCWIYYNNCQDRQMQPTRIKAIVKEASAGNNVIRFNLVDEAVARAYNPGTVQPGNRPS